MVCMANRADSENMAQNISSESMLVAKLTKHISFTSAMRLFKYFGFSFCASILRKTC